MTNHGVPPRGAFYSQQPAPSPAPQAQGKNASHHHAAAGQNVPAGEPQAEEPSPSDEDIIDPWYEGFIFSRHQLRKAGKIKTDVKRIKMKGDQDELYMMVNEKLSKKEGLKQSTLSTHHSVKRLHLEAEKRLEELNNENPGFKWTLAYERVKHDDEIGVIFKRKVNRGKKPIPNAAPKQFTGNVYATAVPNEPQRQPPNINPSYGSNFQQQQKQQQPHMANTSAPFAPLPRRPAKGPPVNAHAQSGYAQFQQQQFQQPPPPPNHPAGGFAPAAGQNPQLWHDGLPRNDQTRNEGPRFDDHQWFPFRDDMNHGATENAMPRDNNQHAGFENQNHAGRNHTQGHGHHVPPKQTFHNMGQRQRFHDPELGRDYDEYYAYGFAPDLTDDSTTVDEDSLYTMSESRYDSRSASSAYPPSFTSYDETDSCGPSIRVSRSKRGRKESRKSRPTKASSKAHPKTASHEKHSGSAGSDKITEEKMRNFVREAVNDAMRPAPASPLPRPPVPATAAAPTPAAPAAAAAAEGVHYVHDSQPRHPVSPVQIHYSKPDPTHIFIHQEPSYYEDYPRGRIIYGSRPYHEAPSYRIIHQEPQYYEGIPHGGRIYDDRSYHESPRRRSCDRRSPHEAHCHACHSHHCHCSH